MRLHMSTITTTIHFYNFDLPAQGAEMKALFKELRGRKHRMMSINPQVQGLSVQDIRARLGCAKDSTSCQVELSTKFLFSDQWNTTEKSGSLRLFNWSGWTAKYAAKGYYLDVTPEMKSLLANTYQCRYCGNEVSKQEFDAQISPFCEECITSEYLTEDTLRLTRMYPVSYNKEVHPLCGEALQFLTIRRNLMLHRDTVERTPMLEKAYREEMLEDSAVATLKYKIKLLALRELYQDVFVHISFAGKKFIVSKISKKGKGFSEKDAYSLRDILRREAFPRNVDIMYPVGGREATVQYTVETKETVV